MTFQFLLARFIVLRWFSEKFEVSNFSWASAEISWKNLLFRFHSKDCQCLWTTDSPWSWIFSWCNYNETHTSRSLTNPGLTSQDKLACWKPILSSSCALRQDLRQIQCNDQSLVLPHFFSDFWLLTNRIFTRLRIFSIVLPKTLLFVREFEKIFLKLVLCPGTKVRIQVNVWFQPCFFVKGDSAVNLR